MSVSLSDVKKAMGVTGDYLDDQLQPFMDDVLSFIVNAGVPENSITAALVARGVLDTWNYGSGGTQLSDYFKMRVTQLALMK